MAGRIPQSFIDDLLNRTDILDVVGSRIQLKKAGNNYSACCPFHNEKTPSFTVSPDKQFYYCFGCGAGGNALGFLMDYDHVDFPEAVEDLARRAGLQVQREAGGGGSPRQPTDSPLYPPLSAAADFYRGALKTHPARQVAVSYLKRRGLSGVIARDYGLGFAPPGRDNLLRHLEGDSLQHKTLLDAGLIVENAETGRFYDRFRDRIIFPIRDMRGRVIAFGGRLLGDGKPKYLNSPETAVFHKGEVLYGLFEARQFNRSLDEVLVLEGYMDVIALAQFGIRNAVATLGTATSEEHIRRLFRLVPSILFCFDGDNAGRKAAWRALESALPSLQDGRQVRFLFLPEGEDPDSQIRSEGAEAFQARLNQYAQPLTDYFFQHLCQEADPDSLEGKAHLVALTGPLLEKIPGGGLKALMRKRLGELTGLDQATLNQLGQAGERQGSGEAHEPPPSPVSSGRFPRPSNFGPLREPAIRKEALRQVETPVITALRTLLRYPELAKKMEHIPNFAAEENTYSQLLISLLETLQKNPGLGTLQLIARWHGTNQGRLLKALMEKEWLIDESSLEQQFFDTICALARRQSNQCLEQLLQKSRQGSLEAEERQQLTELLRQRAQTGQ